VTPIDQEALAPTYWSTIVRSMQPDPRLAAGKPETFASLLRDRGDDQRVT
jgi:hypothetical protein